MKVLLVDDEPLVRQGLRFFLAKEKDAEIVGECENGLQAIEAIRSLEPDLVFLDVQMPELDGFEVIENLADIKLPLVIFVTAYDKYAVKAFEINAVDYLLKPFDQERFEETLRRVRLHLHPDRNENVSEHIKKLLMNIEPNPKRLERIVVKSSGRIFFQPVESISYITSADNYICLHVERKEYLVRKTMQEIENRLDPHKFLRIRQSTIVNIEHIAEINPYGNGEFIFKLTDGARLISSRYYRQKLVQFFES